MNIDISNAHCGPRIQFPDHAWLRVVSAPRNCLRRCSCLERDTRARVRATLDARRGCARETKLSLLLAERVVLFSRREVVTTAERKMSRESVSPPWASSEMTRRRARVRRVCVRLLLCLEETSDGTCARRENEGRRRCAAALLFPSRRWDDREGATRTRHPDRRRRKKKESREVSSHSVFLSVVA